ncbi:MAG TPA: 50S ribosomal protein L3 [Nitrososphaerales archaeon]
MGHRKKSAARHGSLAYLPRGRAKSFNPVLQTWPEIQSDKPCILNFAGFKSGTIHVYTVDDRERTPNFGKPVFNTATVIESPPIFISGFRAYKTSNGCLKVFDEVYSKNQPKNLSKKKKFNSINSEKHLASIKQELKNVQRLSAVCCISPRDANLAQKIPIIFESKVGGNSKESQFEYLQSVLGKTIRVSDIFQPGMFTDTIGITKGHGFEGPVTRMGITKKHHKSRKTVRAVGTIGPWNPSATMYTVPSAGQMGLHRRTEYNKRVIAIGNGTENPIMPKGGFSHYGNVKSDYIILQGSVQGPAKRFIKIRHAIRPSNRKIQTPKILELSIVKNR